MTKLQEFPENPIDLLADASFDIRNAKGVRHTDNRDLVEDYCNGALDDIKVAQKIMDKEYSEIEDLFKYAFPKGSNTVYVGIQEDWNAVQEIFNQHGISPEHVFKIGSHSLVIVVLDSDDMTIARLELPERYFKL